MTREPQVCEKHGNFAPAGFCCACTREPLQRDLAEARAQADELAKALAGVIRDAEASGNFPRIQHTATLIAYQRSQDRP